MGFQAAYKSFAAATWPRKNVARPESTSDVPVRAFIQTGSISELAGALALQPPMFGHWQMALATVESARMTL